MAKVKTFCVEVTVTHKVMLFVEARRPQGALDLLATEDGWLKATQFRDDEILPYLPGRDVTFGTPKVMEP